MKPLYSILTAILLTGLLCGQGFAQNKTGKVYVGYAKYEDQIWEYDGLSLDRNATVGCAILLTRDMLEPYIGGTITGMRVGWDTSQRTGSYTGFVRRTFNGEDLTSSRATTVKYDYCASAPGWNNLTLTQWEIPEDVDQLVVGFTTKLTKGVCSIPILSPKNTKNSCYLWVDGENDIMGNPVWSDMKDRGILPILLIIKDSKGEFNFLPVITSCTGNSIVQTENASDCLLRIKNLGSQAIKSVEVTSTQGEQTYSKKVTLSKAIGPSCSSSSILMPLYCFHSGDVELSITKVNDNPVNTPTKQTLNVLGVSKDVASRYLRRPLVEYYESENNYMSPRYYDEIVQPSLRSKLGKMTFVCQHLDDQFMTGDDDATHLALQLCNNDSASVSIPAMTIDRATCTGNISFQQNANIYSMFSVLYEPYASQAYNAALEAPTFVEINTSGKLGEDLETTDVEVSGEIAEGVLPDGEHLKVTVYLMEHDVFSDSQLFWTDKEKVESEGEYTHANVIREILSDRDGDELPASGDFQKTYQTTIAPEWTKENLYLVAFAHRNGEKGGLYMQVLNSAEGELEMPVGIHNTADKHPATQTDFHDLTGRRVQSPRHGIYILNGKKILK